MTILAYTLGVLGRWKVGIEEMTTVDIGEASTIDRSAVAGSLDRLAEHLAAGRFFFFRLAPCDAALTASSETVP